MLHSTISQNIIEYLRNKIISGDLAAGQRLKEKELANLLKVSTAPVREAFRILENEHLLVNTHRRGCAVSAFSLEDCRQIFKVRETIECCAINLIEEQGITELPDVVSALNSSVYLPNASFEDELKLMREHNPFPEFHIKLVESTGNTWLASLYHTLSPTLARYQFLSYVPGLLKDNLADHREIMRLIQKGSYDRAREALKAHISFMLRRIEEREGKAQKTDFSKV
jgi:DNA-binding GntR family transcriptional regulator